MSALIQLQAQLAIENNFQYTDEDRFLDEVGIDNVYFGIENGDMDKVAAGITAALESADRVNHYLTDIRAMKFVPKAIYVPLKRSLFDTLDDLSLQTTSLATESDKKLRIKVIVVKGNPLYINTHEARNYYDEIKKFLIDNGATDVSFDAGEDLTRPSLDADMYVAHSRGCGRYKFMPDDKKKFFLKFGVADGITHPTDLKWIHEEYVKGTVQQPPAEHFYFTEQQKDAIVSMLNKVKKLKLNNRLATEADYSDGDNYRTLALESLTGALRSIFQAIRKAFAWVWSMLKKIFGFDGERKNKIAENSFENAQKRLENVLHQMNVFDEAKMNGFIADTTIPVVMEMRELYKAAGRDLNSDDIRGDCDRTLGAALLLLQSMDQLYGYQSTLGVFLTTRFLNQDAEGIDKLADSFKSDNPIQHHPVLGDLFTAQRGLLTVLSQKLATAAYKDLTAAQKKELDDSGIDPASVHGISIGSKVCVIVSRKTIDGMPEIDKLLVNNIPLFKVLDGDDKATSTYTKFTIRPPVPTQLEVVKNSFRKFSELAKDFKMLHDSLFRASEKFTIFATALEKSGGEDNGRDYSPLISIFKHMSNVYLNASTCLARTEKIRMEEVNKLQKYMEFTTQAYEYAIKPD